MQFLRELSQNNNLIMIVMNLKIKFLLIFVLAILSSCEEDGYADYDSGETNTQEFAGEWYVVAYDATGAPAFGGDYVLLSTYNTAQNNDSIWIDDHGSWMEIKTRVNTNPNNLTFAGPANAPELITGGTVSVSNGQIIKNGGRAANSGTVTDSIYFEAEFDWEPGVIFTFGGHERTGFEEDEDPHFN